MTSHAKRIQYFSGKSLEQQKKQLVDMIQIFKDKDPVFPKLIQKIQNNTLTTSKALIDIYTDILNFEQLATHQEKEKALQKINTIQHKTQELYRREEVSKKEEKFEDILKQIDF